MGRSQFITASICRRAPIFRTEILARHFVHVLRELRAEMKFACCACEAACQLLAVESVAVDNSRFLYFLIPFLIPSLTVPANCFGLISCTSAAWAQCSGVDRTREGTGRLTPA
jgi:hypothetical protein